MEERELWGDKLVTLALASGKELVRGGGGVRGGTGAESLTLMCGFGREAVFDYSKWICLYSSTSS